MKGDTLADILGVSRSLITLYEKGHNSPTVDDLQRIAAALNIEAGLLYDDYFRFLASPYTDRIKQIREEHNLSSKELGAMLGVTSVTINCWQRGQHVVSRKTWEELKSLDLL